MQDWHHAGCGGQIRPAIVLYGEGFTDETIEGAIQAVAQADLTVVVGTSLQVYPFAGLVDYSQQVLVINKEPLAIPNEYGMLTAAAETFFQKIE